ncbi:hypothetical protein ABIE48_002337 [Paenibacillus sp. OAE614]
MVKTEKSPESDRRCRNRGFKTLVSNVERYKFSLIYLTTLDNTSSMICVLAIVPEYSQLE